MRLKRHQETPSIKRPEQEHAGDAVATKVSADDLDRTIDRLNAQTAPYFRPDGPLMRHRAS